MSLEELRDFGFDVRGINWEPYIVDVHIPGLRRHVMKEDLHPNNYAFVSGVPLL